MVTHRLPSSFFVDTEQREEYKSLVKHSGGAQQGNRSECLTKGIAARFEGEFIDLMADDSKPTRAGEKAFQTVKDHPDNSRHGRFVVL